MEKTTKRALIVESIIGGIIFVVVFLLALANVFSFVYLIVSIVIFLILAGVITALISFMKKKQKSSDELEGKDFISEVEAEKIATTLLFSPDVMEYEKKLLYKVVRYFGSTGNEVPVYIRKFTSEFENKTVCIFVNMKTKKSSFKFYDDIAMSQSAIDTDILREANLLVERPALQPDTEEEIIDRPSGERVTRTRLVRREDEEEVLPKEEVGGME